MNTLAEYTYFYISKKITPHTFLLLFKIVESLECIFNYDHYFTDFLKISRSPFHYELICLCKTNESGKVEAGSQLKFPKSCMAE